MELVTQKTTVLTPRSGVQANIEAMSPGNPSKIIVGMNDRDPRYHDLYRIDIVTGEKRLIQRADREAPYFLVDNNLRVRLAARLVAGGAKEILKPNHADGWEFLFSISPEDQMATRPLGFDGTGTTVYMRDSRGRETAALTTIHLVTGKEEVVAEDDRSDLGDVLLHPRNKTVEAVSFTYDRKRWLAVDRSVGPDIEYLGTVETGDMTVLSRSLDNDLWVVGMESDVSPTRFYLYDRHSRRAEFLMAERTDVASSRLSKMYSSVTSARDGLDLVSYYSLPPWTDGGSNSMPDRPLPTVLLVHGGPWWRDTWGYRPMHQWLANRGYAVLSVNFRGSLGFGKAFVNAGNLEWGGKMQEDLIDVVAWAVDAGIADPLQVAITGLSYGGYATLMGLASTPDVFTCGVDLCGPSSLSTQRDTRAPYWDLHAERYAVQIGDPGTEEGLALLIDRSPLTHVHRIKKPLLIGQGVNDPRVNRAQSEQIVQAIGDEDIPVTYLLYPDEGHGLVRAENVLSFRAVMEAFLAQHLGGRSEALGDDLKGSSITVPSGARFIA